MNKQQKFSTVLILTVIFTAIIISSLPYHNGISIFNAGDYARNAFQLSKGMPSFEEGIFAHRVIAYLPYTLGIVLFGYGSWITFITTGELIILLGIIFWFLSRYDRTLTFTMISFLGLSEIILSNSSVVMGDILLTLTTNTAIFLYIVARSEYMTTIRCDGRLGSIIGTLLVASFFIKESALFLGLVFIIFFIRDLKSYETRRFWFSFWGTLITEGLIVGIIYKIFTGDFFKYIEMSLGVADFISRDGSSYATRTTVEYLVQPLSFLFMEPVFGMCFLFAAGYVFSSKKTLTDVLVKCYIVTSVGSWWLFSQYIHAWSPLSSVVHRLWIPFLVPLLVGSFFFFRYEISSRRGDGITAKKAVMLSLLVVISLIISNIEYHQYGKDFPWLKWCSFIGYLVFIWIIFLVRNFHRKGKLFIVMLYLIIPSTLVLWRVLLVNDLKEENIPNAFSDEQEVIQFLEKNYSGDTVFCEPALSKNKGIYTGFSQSNYFIIWPDSVPQRGFLMVNTYRMDYLINGINETPGYVFSQNDVPYYVLFPERHGFKEKKKIGTSVLYEK